jgi:mannitol-1-phosphate/altronate dehydrogenase
MKNKIFSLVLALLLMLSVTACQNTAIGGDKTQKTVPENREPQTDKLIIYMNPFCSGLIDRAVAEFRKLYPDVDWI